MTQELTDRQREVFEFVRESVRSEGRAPTIREIAAHFGFASQKPSSDFLDALEKKGYISRRPPETARNIVVREELSPHGIPVVREVPSEKHLLRPDNIEKSLTLPTFFGTADDVFALRMPDESMLGAGIQEGDYVVAERDQTVGEGEMAAVVLEETPTVRHIFREKEPTVLVKPDNPDYEELAVEDRPGETWLLGRVQGLIRTM